MRVTVKLFATLSRFSPGGLPGVPFEVEISDGASLQGLANLLKIPPDETKIAFVNAVIQPLEYVLQPQDEIGIFPPIGGG
jgi:molybdopterin converting factor small subunit